MPKASIRARRPVSRRGRILISCTRRAISVAAVPVQKDDPADQRLARVVSSRCRRAFGNLSFGVHIRRHCVKWGIMRHNLVDNCARRALAIFASAALVAGLVPVAAFGEVGGGPSVADASSDARLVEQGAQTGAGSANVPSEGGDTSGAGSVSGPGVDNASASGSESAAPSELSAPSGSDTFDGGNNAGSPSFSDAGNLSGSSSDSTRAAAPALPIPATPQAPPNPRRPKRLPM